MRSGDVRLGIVGFGNVTQGKDFVVRSFWVVFSQVMYGKVMQGKDLILMLGMVRCFMAKYCFVM